MNNLGKKWMLIIDFWDLIDIWVLKFDNIKRSYLIIDYNVFFDYRL